MKTKEVEKLILKIAIKVAKRGEGGMIILGDKLRDYNFLVNQDIKPFKLSDNPKTAESLIMQDGALWVGKHGIIKGYGVAMKKITPILNKGTRHGSAIYCSKLGNKVFLISQEDKNVKIYYKGELVMQIDATKKGINKVISPAVNFLEVAGIGGIASIVAPIIGLTGITLIPGIVIFGIPYFVLKSLIKRK